MKKIPVRSNGIKAAPIGLYYKWKTRVLSKAISYVLCWPIAVYDYAVTFDFDLLSVILMI